MCKSTVNIESSIVQPKREKMQIIQPVTKNWGKWEEVRQCQKKNGWLFSTEFQSINSKYRKNMGINYRQKQR